MSEFLEKDFLNNSVHEWLIALLIVTGGFFLAKLLYLFLNKLIAKLSRKTDTKADDVIIDMVEEPFVFAIVITGFWYATEHLSIADYIIEYRSKVFYFLITFNIAWIVVRIIDAIMVEILTPLASATESELDDQLIPIVRKTLKWIIWIVAIVVALNNAGYDVGALIAGLGIGGLALAMAAKDSVANLFGGITVFMAKPFVIKDRVKVAGYDGRIKEIGIRSTQLVTMEGRTVTIPNSKFIDSAIENVTSEPARKIITNIGLAYTTKPDKMIEAQEIIREILISKTEIEKETLQIFMAGFGGYALELTFIYWVLPEADVPVVQNAVNLEILTKFDKINIEYAIIPVLPAK